MPVKAFTVKPVAPNPELSVGQIYRITDTDGPSSFNRRVDSYFSAIPTQGLIVYLASNPNTGGFDSANVLERYNVSFEIVTLAEVSHV